MDGEKVLTGTQPAVIVGPCSEKSWSPLKITGMLWKPLSADSMSYFCLQAKYAQSLDKVLEKLTAQASKKGRKMAAYVCPSGYELCRSYLSSLLCGSASLLRFRAAYTALTYRNHRDCMTAQIHIFLMKHYHGEIASALLAASVRLHLGTRSNQSLSFASWVETLPWRTEYCKYLPEENKGRSM